MPEIIETGAFVFGAVLVLLALVSGGFKIFGAEVSGTAGQLARVIAFFLGLFFVSVGLWRSGGRSPVEERSAGGSPIAERSGGSHGSVEERSSGASSIGERRDGPSPVQDLPTIAGTWIDSTGSIFEVTRTGPDTFSFKGRNARTGLYSEGAGSIKGRQFYSTFVTSIPSTGTGTGALSPDGRELTGTFTDSSLGVYSQVLRKQ
jgi:hypothetical protein